MYGDKRESGSLGRMALVLGGVSGSGSSWVFFWDLVLSMVKVELLRLLRWVDRVDRLDLPLCALVPMPSSSDEGRDGETGRDTVSKARSPATLFGLISDGL